jgi:hypothetical protein
MANGVRIGLDNPAFYGRLGQPRLYAAPTTLRRTVRARHRPDSPIRSIQSLSTVSILPPIPLAAKIPQAQYVELTKATDLQIIVPQPFAKPSEQRLQASAVLQRQLFVTSTKSKEQLPVKPLSKYFVHRVVTKHKIAYRKLSKVQFGLVAMACLVFTLGIGTSIQSLLTNNAASAQVAALSKVADTQSTTTGQGISATIAPSVTKPSTEAVAMYAVAADLAKYIKIPKLGVDARVLQVGVTTSGALATPSNVFDTAWYTGSAKPGQPGATLIDGHVSSWTTKGVFYGIKTLVAGDTIQIVKGDNSVLTYKVVKTQVYPAGTVDMQAAVTPVIAGQSGLNLITCTGQVIKGTSEFNQRELVFATLVT